MKSVVSNAKIFLARYQGEGFLTFTNTVSTIVLHCKCCGISVICLRIDSMNFYEKTNVLRFPLPVFDSIHVFDYRLVSLQMQ